MNYWLYSFILWLLVGCTINCQVTPEIRRLILGMHNKLRNDLVECKVSGQPPAKKLGKLYWNSELERQAQGLANTCRWGHDESRQRITRKWKWVGQNIAGYSTIKKAVQLWIDEYKDYYYSSNWCRRVCGHYTQMVWANTTAVGCGVRDCSGTSFRYGTYVVCNYGPGGNYNGEKPYAYGDVQKCSHG